VKQSTRLRDTARSHPAAEADDERHRREFEDAVSAITAEDVARHRPDEDDGTEACDPPSGRRTPPVRETVDLHGCTVPEAVAQVEAALVRWRGRDARIRVIVGKGNHAPGGVGVLRDAIPAWLDGAARHLVAEWRWGGRGSGGSGVIILRVRRAAEDRSRREAS